MRAAALAAAAAVVVLALAAPRAPAVAQGAAGLAGVVTDHADRRLEGASIVVEGDSVTAITDRRGEFRLRGLRPGRRRFFLRRVGYQPVLFEVELPPASVVSVHARLEPSPISLGTMEIEGRRQSLPLFQQGFYERAGLHPQGWFFPPEEIVRRRITTVTTLLSEIPGVTIQRRNGESYAAGRSVGTGPCPFDIWIDGMRVDRGVNDLEVLAPGAIVRAVEVYPSAASVPARFVRNNTLCGALVIWTKGTVRELF